MCLLIANPERKPIPKSVFETATESNGDGFGVSFIRKGKAVIRKGINISPERQFKLCQRFNWPEVMHWRFSTSGGVCGKMAHPFRLAPTMTLAHNGVLPLKPVNGLSDTATLVRQLRKTPFEAVARLREMDFKGNKFCVLNTEKLDIVGEEQGTWKDGVWYSNETGFESRYAKYCTNWRSSKYVSAYDDIPYDETDNDPVDLGYIDRAVETLSEDIEWELNSYIEGRSAVALRTLQHALDNYRLTRAI